MRFRLLCFAIFHFPAIAASAQVSGPAADRVRQATYFVTVKGAVADCQGAAFVVGTMPPNPKRPGENLALLVTAAHVVDLEDEPRISVVVNAGSKDEKVLQAQKVAVDWTTDVAILAVPAEGLAAPLSLAGGDGTGEGASLTVFGFPDSSGRTTHATVRDYETTIKCRRSDDFGRLIAFELNADILAAGGGGPLCDASGKVVAIGLATLKKRGLSLAIPAREVREALDGKGAGLLVEQKDLWQGTLRLQATTMVVDPRHRVSRYSVIAIRKDSIKGEIAPAADGAWKPLAGAAQEFDLQVSGSKATGEISLKDPKAADADATWFFQLKAVREDKSVWCEEPLQGIVNFAKGLHDASRSRGRDAWSDDPAGAGAPAVEWKPRPLAGETKTVDGGKVTAIAIPDATAHVSSLCWNADQSGFYVAEKAGVLRLISWPDLVENAQAVLGHPVSRIAVSKEGVLAVVSDLQDAWLLDPATLKVKNKFHVADAGWVTASPASSVAFVAGKPAFGPFSASTDTLTVLDLKAGKQSGEYSGKKVGREEVLRAKRPAAIKEPRDIEWNAPTLSPDAKFLFVQSRNSIHRFKVSGSKISLEEISPVCGLDAARFVFSADSAFVAVHVNTDIPVQGFEKLGRFGSYVFRVKDLQNPVARSAHRCPWFSRENGPLMSCEGGDLLIQSWKNEKLREIELGEVNGSFIESGGYFLLHPSGTGAIVMSKGLAARVEFDKDLK